MTTLEQYIYTPDVLKKYNSLHQDDEYFYFYKHFWINKEKEIFQIFKKFEFRYQSPLGFNDPFDCHFAIDFNLDGFNKERFIKYISTHATAQELNLYNNNWDYYKEICFKNVQHACTNDAYLESFRKMWGVVCFNNNPLNLLLWSHYTDSHKGFSIEFKFPKSLYLLPLPITYTDTYPVVIKNWDDTKSLDSFSQAEIINKGLLTKSNDWSYEKEFRLISNFPGNIEFDPNLFSSIIMGVGMSDPDKIKLRQSVDEMNSKHGLDVKIYQAALANKFYKLEVPNHPRLDQQHSDTSIVGSITTNLPTPDPTHQ